MRFGLDSASTLVVAGGLFALLPFSGAAAYTEGTLYTFCSAKHCSDGKFPLGELVMDQAGNFYGTTDWGGANGEGRGDEGDGVVFEYAPGTGKYSVIYDFCSQANCVDGKNPYRVKLVVDTAGNLYGTTMAGGAGSGGTVFELVRDKSGWREKVLYSFCPNPKRGCPKGSTPHTGLTYAGAAAGEFYDGSSPLYGTIYSDGVFSLTPHRGKEWEENLLYSFCSQQNCTDGAEPDTPLYIDTAGNIYGTTTSGGQFNINGGTVFELSPNGSGYTQSTLYSFCAEANCADGQNPEGGLIMDGAGNLLGTASMGGSKGKGVIFELSLGGEQWQYSILANFDGHNGRGPLGLSTDASGNVFGITITGGTRSKGGTVFEFNGSVQSLYDFCSLEHCIDGQGPFASVIEDSVGNLYGTAEAGGHHNGGTIYKLSP